MLALAVAAVELLSPRAALAQRTDDNVTTESDDAFGRSVGNESIGIYNAGDVRGFSPIDAGNVRIEGLYFDRQTDPPTRGSSKARRSASASPRRAIRSPRPPASSTTTCGASARSASSAPCCVYGPFGSMGVEVDAQFPLVREQLGVAVGAGIYRDAFRMGRPQSSRIPFAIVPRWTPTQNIELRPFFSRHAFQRRGNRSR